MGFFFDPSVKEEAHALLETVMLDTKKEMECCLPFAMDPVVFKYGVNGSGTVAELIPDDPAKDVDEGKPIAASTGSKSTPQDLDELLREEGFDMIMQEQIRNDLLSGRIGEKILSLYPLMSPRTLLDCNLVRYFPHPPPIVFLYSAVFLVGMHQRACQE